MSIQLVPRYALVYQAGIANVFAVDINALKPETRKRTKRVLQSDFRGCEMFCRGLVEAGAQVRSYMCNESGDVQERVWSIDLHMAPFSDQFHPVNSIMSYQVRA